MAKELVLIPKTRYEELLEKANNKTTDVENIQKQNVTSIEQDEELKGIEETSSRSPLDALQAKPVAGKQLSYDDRLQKEQELELEEADTVSDKIPERTKKRNRRKLFIRGSKMINIKHDANKHNFKWVPYKV